jgi:hypothetical protein
MLEIAGSTGHPEFDLNTWRAPRLSNEPSYSATPEFLGSDQAPFTPAVNQNNGTPPAGFHSR